MRVSASVPHLRITGIHGQGLLCTAAACSFIALAAWVRRLPFSALKSNVVTEYLQFGQVNVVKPWISLML
jgi:hypothetical protein